MNTITRDEYEANHKAMMAEFAAHPEYMFPSLSRPMIPTPEEAARMKAAFQQATIDQAVELSSQRPTDHKKLGECLDKIMGFDGKPDDHQKRQLKEIEKNILDMDREYRSKPQQTEEDAKYAAMAAALVEAIAKLIERLMPSRGHAAAPRPR